MDSKIVGYRWMYLWSAFEVTWIKKEAINRGFPTNVFVVKAYPDKPKGRKLRLYTDIPYKEWESIKRAIYKRRKIISLYKENSYDNG